MPIEIGRSLLRIERVSDLTYGEIHELACDEFAIDAYGFLRKHGFAPEDFGWFQPDHLAIKAKDLADYLGLLVLFETKCQELYEASEGERKITSGRLFNPIPMGPFSEIWRVELMQPKADKIGKDIVGIDHMEIVCPDLTSVERRLREAGLEYLCGGNEYHKTRGVKINRDGQELKFTDKGNRQVIEEQLVDRKVWPLHYGFID